MTAVNQFQKILEDQIKKEEEENNISDEEEVTLEDQDYGFESDPFEPDDPDSLKQDI